ncbi:MAG: hypothetical protein ACOH16_07500 [Propionibacteriaceae bacterium]
MIEWMRRVARLRPFAVAAVIVAVGAILMSASHIRHYPQISPVDELQHIDYLYRAPGIVHMGEKVGQSAMHEQACRTLPGYTSPPCSDTIVYNALDFQETGVNTAAVYTPFYYAVTRVIATPLTWILGEGSLVTAGRLVSGLYLAAGLLVTLAVARRFGAHAYTTAAILLAASSTPVVLLPSATITPDSLGILAGASLVWAVLWWQESPNSRVWLPILAGVATVLCKAVNVIAVMLVALYVVVHYAHGRLWPPDPPASSDGDQGRRLTLLQAALLVIPMSVAALAASIGYVLYINESSVAAATPMGERSMVPSFPFIGFFNETGSFLRVFYPPGNYITTHIVGSFVQNVTGLLIFSCTFAAAFLVAGRRTSRLMSVALLVVGLVAAPMIVAATYFTSHIYVPIPGRYAITLIPVGLATAASAVHRRPAQVFIIVSAIMCYIAVQGWMFTLPM